ncbi:ABC transporter permease [Streptacidiphilus jiangxiensis]|uniref:Osmoprotectant transport system permease protein n=1 Tax=Streptacidiphilus jiangxiensis TaxID=235985 RepID=A0A1H7URH2_STRJI|nr:ABC transporter permease [Streptacidiphilus jiangxiensis]SEL99268.1 osmoprotectant transport system permease protein [Streptacidiphilus jiangxiensis]
MIQWLNDPGNWTAPGGILDQLRAHLQYSIIALVIAVALALPVGLLIGHTGRGRWLVTVANAMRALPVVGLLILLYVMLAPHIHGKGDTVYLLPTEIVLVLLAIPPILAGTVSGVENVAPDVRDAAAAMGMRGSQVVRRVELPNALPLVFSGLRSATLQVIATATVAAYLGLGGLGRFVYDGQASQNYAERNAGAVLVALLAVAADLVLALAQRYTVSRGVSGRFPRGRTSEAADGPGGGDLRGEGGGAADGPPVTAETPPSPHTA